MVTLNKRHSKLFWITTTTKQFCNLVDMHEVNRLVNLAGPDIDLLAILERMRSTFALVNTNYEVCEVTIVWIFNGRTHLGQDWWVDSILANLQDPLRQTSVIFHTGARPIRQISFLVSVDTEQDESTSRVRKRSHKFAKFVRDFALVIEAQSL